MLPCVCSVIDHRRHQNVVRISDSVTHLAIALGATFLFLPHFDVIGDQAFSRDTMSGHPLSNILLGVLVACNPQKIW